MENNNKNIFKTNLILGIIVIALAVLPLIIAGNAEFGGADGAAGDYISVLRPGYQPWFESFWEPPSGEIESLLFSLQAAIGSGIVFGYIGYLMGKSKGREEGTEEKKGKDKK